MKLNEMYALADALYRKGRHDRSYEKDYDPRGTQEWQAVIDALDALRTKNEEVARILLENNQAGAIKWAEGLFLDGTKNPLEVCAIRDGFYSDLFTRTESSAKAAEACDAAKYRWLLKNGASFRHKSTEDKGMFIGSGRWLDMAIMDAMASEGIKP